MLLVRLFHIVHSVTSSQLAMMVAAVIALPASGQALNTLTQEETAAGWKLLFNGTSNAGWLKTDGSPGQFTLEESALGASGGDICTQEEYQDFEFVTDYKYGTAETAASTSAPGKAWCRPTRAASKSPSRTMAGPTTCTRKGMPPCTASRPPAWTSGPARAMEYHARAGQRLPPGELPQRREGDRHRHGLGGMGFPVSTRASSATAPGPSGARTARARSASSTMAPRSCSATSRC